MHTTNVIALLASLIMAVPLRADLWTNHAGRVIEGRIEAFDGAQVTLTRMNGSRLSLSLSALCQSDQHRVRLLAGHSVAPLFVQGAYRDARTILEQFERLPAEQRTEEARTGCLRMACAIFDARLKSRMDELKDKAVLEEVRRLRASLQSQ
jgi:hypothetical protein